VTNPISLTRTLQQPFSVVDHRHLFEESPVPMYIFDSETFHFLDINNAAILQYGYTKDELLQMKVTHIRPIEDAEAFVKISQFLPEQFYDAGRWRHQHKNGDVFHVHVYSHRLVYNDTRATMALAVNVEKQVKAEKELQEKIEETAKILETITDGFFALNEEWEFTNVNKEFERLMGRNRNEFLGKNIWSLLPDIKEGSFALHFNDAMNKKQTVHFEAYYSTADIWLSVNAYPDKEGIAVYFVDITAQRNYLEKIKRQNETLKNIAWTNSHKVRNHVANIVGLTSLFNKNNDEAFTEELISKLQDSAVKLDLIIKEIVHSTA
jgi:PAS domain S-box-containing protein